MGLVQCVYGSFNEIFTSMPQCSVPGCTKQGGHKFPRKNPQLLKKWQVAIKREEPGKPGKLWQPGLSARVCSLHFNDDDYKTLNYYGNFTLKRNMNLRLYRMCLVWNFCDRKL